MRKARRIEASCHDIKVKNQQAQNIESGSIPKLLAKLAIPAVVAQIVNLLYNIVDRIYIGHMADIGAAALTGVGLFTPILMLIMAFAMLAGAGGAPRAAISMGEKDVATAEKIMGNCFSLLMVFAVFLAEPVSDILAAVITTACFLMKFDAILRKKEQKA